MTEPPGAEPVDRPPPPGRLRWLVEMVVLFAGLALTVFGLGTVVARALSVEFPVGCMSDTWQVVWLGAELRR